MDKRIGTTLRLTNFPPCGNVKINGRFPEGLEGNIDKDTVTVTIPNLEIGTHSLEVDSGLDVVGNKYNDIVICKNEGEVKTIDLSRFFCTLCIDGYDVNYKLYMDDVPCKYFVSTHGIVTGSKPGKHILFMKSKEKELEKEIEVKHGLNKISLADLFRKNDEEKTEPTEEIEDEEVQRIAEELSKISTVKVKNGGVKIIKPKQKPIERPVRDVFIPPPLPRIKAKRVESVDNRISIPPPEMKEEVRKETVVKPNVVENRVEPTLQSSNVVDIRSARSAEREQAVNENIQNVSEDSSIVSTIGIGGAIAAGLYLLFKK